MKKIIFILFTLLFLNACASYPPPIIENKTYISPKYEFSIDLPEGWEQTDKIPDWIKKSITPNLARKIKIMLSHQETNGIIIISSDKHVLDASILPEKEMEEMLNKIFEARKKKSLNKTGVENCSYKIESTYYFGDPMLMVSEDGIINIDFIKFKSKGMNYMYVCHDDDTCALNILLISDSKTFDKNYKVFEKLLKSLKKYDYIPQ